MSFLYAASVASFVLALLHLIAGGTGVARPLLQAKDMTSTARHTQYFVWHVVTATLLASAVGFAYAAANPSGRDVAIGLFALNTTCAVWGVIAAFWKGEGLAAMPQGPLYLVIVVLAALGLWL